MRVRANVIKFLGLVLCALALQASSATAQKEGGKEKDSGKKFEIPKNAIAGTVKAVDMAKATFTITQKDKKDHTCRRVAKALEK
jgi:hypothetical protein